MAPVVVHGALADENRDLARLEQTWEKRDRGSQASGTSRLRAAANRGTHRVVSASEAQRAARRSRTSHMPHANPATQQTRENRSRAPQLVAMRARSKGANNRKQRLTHDGGGVRARFRFGDDLDAGARPHCRAGRLDPVEAAEKCLPRIRQSANDVRTLWDPAGECEPARTSAARTGVPQDRLSHHTKADHTPHIKQT